MPSLDFSRQYFEKNYSSNINSIKLVNMENLCESKKKKLKKYLVLEFLDCNFKTYCNIWNHQPEISQSPRFCAKKSLRFETKGIYKARAIVISQISTLEVVKNGLLAETVNLGIGSTFSKGLRSAVSEDLGTSLSRLYSYAQKCNMCNIDKVHFSTEIIQVNSPLT